MSSRVVIAGLLMMAVSASAAPDKAQPKMQQAQPAATMALEVKIASWDARDTKAPLVAEGKRAIVVITQGTAETEQLASVFVEGKLVSMWRFGTKDPADVVAKLFKARPSAQTPISFLFDGGTGIIPSTGPGPHGPGGDPGPKYRQILAAYVNAFSTHIDTGSAGLESGLAGLRAQH